MDVAGPGLDRIARDAGATVIPVDFRRPDEIKRAVAAARRQIPRIDALVLTSGIVENRRLDEMTLDLWNEVILVNVTGLFFFCQAAADWLADGARVVTFGSRAGRTPGPVTGPAYAVSKAAVENLTRYLAIQWAPRRITVNCIAPGPVDTPMLDAHPEDRMAALVDAIPFKRLASADEIAALVAYLVSDDAGYMTGAVLPINGGLAMS
jgi:3-oxoacyl-[acyl-carrier protein] reductase